MKPSHAESLKLSQEISAPEQARRLQLELNRKYLDHKETHDENTNLKASIERGEVWVDGNLYRTELIGGKSLNRTPKTEENNHTLKAVDFFWRALNALKENHPNITLEEAHDKLTSVYKRWQRYAYKWETNNGDNHG